MVKFALKTPYTILVAGLIMLIVGVFSMLKMPLDILPVFRLPAVMVVTTYTGMPAQMIEFDITNRLERWLSQANGLDRIESRSMIGVSILNCYFEPGFDPNNALAQISTLVMSDLHYLPPGVQPPIVVGYDPTASLPVAVMTINTDGMDEAKIWDESNFIVRNQLNAVPGAVAPVVFGGKTRQIMVYLNPADLAGHGESPLEIVKALSSQNSMVPTGDAKIGKFDFSIVSNGMVPDLKSFADIPIRITGGAPVFLKDIGAAQDSSATQTNVVQVDGVRQTYIPLSRRIGASTLAVVNNIRKVIPDILKDLPPMSHLKLLFDQSPKVSEAIFDVIRELVIGVLLAALVIYLFLGSLTPTFIASLIIPLSILGGMLALYYMGQTLNLMTLGGLALITGPLIDKSVVAIENIERHLEMGATPYDAALKGTSEVAMPVLMASLALIVVFFPVTFFEGLGKFLFIPMAASVAVTEIISYFAVMTMVPLMASKMFKHKDDHHGVQSKAVRIFNEYFNRLKTAYQGALDSALARPQVIVAIVCVALVGSLFLVPMIGTEFFPEVDHGQFFIRIRGETGTRIEVMSEAIEQISSRIHELLPKDSVDDIMANTGVINSWAAAYSPNSASHDSLLEVELKEGGPVNAREAIKILREGLHAQFPDMQFSFSLIDPVSSALNYGALNSIDLRVVSKSLAEGHDVAESILKKVQTVRGVKDAFIEQELNYPGLKINVNRTQAAYLGLTTDEVIKNIITAINSSVLFAPNFWDDPVSGNNYFIGAMYPEQEIKSLETILNVPIIPVATNDATKNRKPVLLRNVAELVPVKLPVEISHVNIKRVFDIMANVEDRDIGGVASSIDEIVSKMQLPPGYSVKWVGQVNSMRASFSSMGGGLILSLVLIFLLLVAQLKSFVDPLLILATVPMGFIGVFWILFLTNTTLNIQSMMGMIMLIGIVVSNTVILTDYANSRLEDGVAPNLAIREAGLTRLRPILMTAISAIMALLPSAFGGANAPLARAVIGGLLSSTFLSLIFLPALFVLVKKRKDIAEGAIGGH